MTTELPENPESREESYLADIAGQDVELPEKPLSRKEQYLAYIAENGGGGGGGTSNFNQLTNRPKYDNSTMTGSTNIPKVPTKTSELSNDSGFVASSSLATVATTGAYSDLTGTPTIPVVNNATLTITQNGTSVGTFTANSSTDTTIAVIDTTYSAFTGTDGTSAGVAGLVPAPATTDAGKFLKADGTWDTAGGGGGDTVYSTKTTSNSATGGAVYIGNLGTDQIEVQDPSPNDNHYKYFWALPYSNNGASYGQPGDGSVTILGSAKGAGTVAIGSNAGSGSYGAPHAVMIGHNSNAGASGVSIGDNSGTTQDFTGNVCIGSEAVITELGVKNSICLGRFSKATRTGELNIGAPGQFPAAGFSNTNYRVIGGVHDGVELTDAATVAQGNTLSTSAPTTSTEGVLGQLWTDTTNMHTYQCTAISGSTYTWTMRW